MSEKFEGFREAKPQITEEEKMLAEKAHEAGGESKLPREEVIRLIALRYMRGGQEGIFGITRQPLSESDAVELATMERDVDEAGGESKLPKEEAIRLIALRYMRGGQVTPGITYQPLSESDAVELATIEVNETSGELNVTPEVFDRKKVLRKKLGEK